jgi:hypothetical protein
MVAATFPTIADIASQGPLEGHFALRAALARFAQAVFGPFGPQTLTLSSAFSSVHVYFWEGI